MEALRLCLRAGELAEKNDLEGARGRLAEAGRLSPEDEAVQIEIKRLRGRFKL